MGCEIKTMNTSIAQHFIIFADMMRHKGWHNFSIECQQCLLGISFYHNTSQIMDASRNTKFRETKIGGILYDYFKLNNPPEDVRLMYIDKLSKFF